MLTDVEKQTERSKASSKRKTLIKASIQEESKTT